MCEQTEVQYLDGDVVWVKLGPCWWPGEVKDLSKLPPEIAKDFKKPPIAVVKFFQEDQYEYIKNLNHIYKYNCRRKNDFIKKGLDMHRAKNTFMDKFPADVCHAETLTGGDPDIITNDEFAPDRKPSYHGIFASTSPKKPKTGLGRGRHSTGSTPRSVGRPSSTPRRLTITHPRFVGRSDHEVRILEQSTPTAPTSHYTCHICGFESARLNVIVLHNRSHSNGTFVSPSKGKKKKTISKRKSFATTNSIDEDLELIRQGFVISTEETSDSEADDKRKNGNKRKNNKAASSTTKKAKVSNICNNLLADWGDTDDEESEDGESSKKEETNKSVQNELLADWEEKTSDDESKKSPENKTTEEKASDKSCFDFQEEDDTFVEKPPNKRLSKDTEDINVKNEPESSKEKETIKEKEIVEPDFVAFNNLLEETAVPDIPLPSEMSKKDDTIDKTNGVMKAKQSEPETTDNEVINKEPIIATIPKKRIVRNFEEFESLLNESKPEEEEEEVKSKSTLEVSKLKSQLMSKLNDTPIKKTTPPKRIETPEPESEDSKLEEDESQSSESFQKKSESEDTDFEKKDTTSQDTSFSEDKSIESMEIDNKSEETSEKTETSQETVLEESVEKNENLEEIPVIPAPIIEENSQKTQNEEEKIREEEKTEEKEFEEEKTKENEFEEEKTNEKELEEEKIKEKEFEEAKTKENEFEEEKLKEDEIEEKITKEDEREIEEERIHQKEINDESIDNEYITEEKVKEKEVKDEEAKQELMDVNIPMENKEILEENIIEELSNKDDDESKENAQKEKDQQENVLKAEERSQKMLVDISDICIDNSDNLSGLSTLAAVSELTGNLYDKQETCAVEPEMKEEEVNQTNEDSRGVTPVLDELPDKPVRTLANFSMDFSDSNSESTIIKSIKHEETVPEKTAEKEEPKMEISEKSAEFESIENEIEKITSLETASDKLHSFPENITVETTSYSDFQLADTGTSIPGSGEFPKIEPVRETLESEIAKLTDQPEEQPVVQEQQPQNTSSSKLLEILTDSKKNEQAPRNITSSHQKIQMVISGDKSKKFDPKTSKFVIKSAQSKTAKSKPIILSEKIIKPITEIENVQVKKVTSKRTYQDVEDIDTFIIQKPTKKSNSGELDQQDFILTQKSEPKYKPISRAGRGKPKIIEQTIIKAADVVQQNEDDSMFDINSMPIVLSDQILTPESIDNMSMVMTDLLPSTSGEKPQQKRGGAVQQVKILNKGKVMVTTQESKLSTSVVKTVMSRGLGKNQKVYQTGSKTLKNNPAIITQPGKPGKFIILPTSSTSTGSKYTVGKRLTSIKSSTFPTTSKLKPVQNISSEPTGNKIMVVTNQHGVQSRVLLTPAQQKLIGCKLPGTKVAKNTIMSKSILAAKKPPQTIVTSKGQMITTQPGQMLVTSEGQVLTPITQQQLKSKPGQKIKIQSNRVIMPDKDAKTKIIGTKTKTVLIKGAQGQTLKKIQATGSDKNLLLSPAGQKQLVSLASHQITGKQVVVTSKGQLIKPDSKLLQKQAAEKLQRTQKSLNTSPRIVSKPKTQLLINPTKSSNVPPLAPIHKKETQSKIVEQKQKPADTTIAEQKPPNQLIIQDTMGHQTTVTEGQILALPSGETVDGQPQSYVLVTVDESGNLVPISNETLMSLDPTFAGDMNNIVLQIDPGAQEAKSAETTLPAPEINQQIVETEQQFVDNQQLLIQDQNVLPAVTEAETQIQEPETFVREETQDAQQTAVACSINNGDSSQQLIITGDPESTQKFLASLSEGNTDLSSLLSGTDGNIIINTDGQQILLNTDSENQILLSVNSDNNLGLIQDAQNAMYTQQTNKNQDILAAALADTDVFQQESTKVATTQPQLSPNSSLYPMNVSNVLETSLTLGSPIMTPLEVPSVTTKKINTDEQTLITQVPSSLELPITITDPSISQTVSQQVMLGSELQTNLELPISISDTTITSIRSSEMNSPNFVYSLPTLDDNTELEQKRSFVETSTDNIYSTSLTGSMSMPLLTEEPEIQPDLQAEIQSDLQPEIQTDLQPEIQSELQTEIQSDLQTDIQSDLQTEIQSDLQTEIQPDLQTEIQPDLQTEIQSGLETEIQSEIQPENNVEQEQIPAVPTIEEETLETCETITKKTSEQTENLSLNSENLESAVPEKIPELQIPIEEELDLNQSDICSSLSEPPPGMFDKSFSNFLNKPEEELSPVPQEAEVSTEINTPTNETCATNSLPILTETTNSDILTSAGKNSEDFGVSPDQQSETVAIQQSELSETPNSDLNSPRLDIDENSGEIPIQPPIITNLEDFNSKKRVLGDDEDENDAKRTKLSCD